MENENTASDATDAKPELPPLVFGEVINAPDLKNLPLASLEHRKWPTVNASDLAAIEIRRFEASELPLAASLPPEPQSSCASAALLAQVREMQADMQALIENQKNLTAAIEKGRELFELQVAALKFRVV